MNRKRNVDKVVRGRRKPWMPTPVWEVKAKEVNSTTLRAEFYDEQSALKHADWWHNHPCIVDVVVEGPPYTGPIAEPTEHDRMVGDSLVDLLECAKVGPVQKYLLGRWMDSKAWGGAADA